MKTVACILLFCTLSSAVPADPVFGGAENCGTPLNTIDKDGDAWESPDGLELHFFSGRDGGIGLDDLWVSRRPSRNAAWGEPANLGEPVNTRVFEWGPSLSADGLTLYFVSSRRDGHGGYDLWYAIRAEKGAPWGEPVNFGSPPNDEFDVDKPALSPDGLELIFSDGEDAPYRPGGRGRADLWVSRRESPSGPWSEPRNLGANVNTEHAEYTSCLSADGLMLFFASDRPGGLGGLDIWAAVRDSPGGEWGEPRNLGPAVNSQHRELRPFLTADGSCLYFTSPRPGRGSADLWRAPVLSW